MRKWVVVVSSALILVMVSGGEGWGQTKPRKVPTERTKFLERSYVRTWAGVTENGGFDPYAMSTLKPIKTRAELEAEKREAMAERERLRAEWVASQPVRERKKTMRFRNEEGGQYDLESIRYTRPEHQRPSDETRHPGRNGDWRPRVGERGTFIASWYGNYFHGEKTASGEQYNMFAFTAAHRMLPFGTKLKLTNPENGASVIVVINDWGPDVAPREIDVSYAAAEALGFTSEGTVLLEFEIIEVPS